MKRFHNKFLGPLQMAKSRRGRRGRKSRRRSRRTQRGGIAPVSDIGTILTPLEQSQIFEYPPIDDWSFSHLYKDSRTPYLNVARHAGLSLYEPVWLQGNTEYLPQSK
jgi:hypothetical protein